MSWSSENFKTEAIWSMEHVCGVFTFWDHFGPSLDQVGTMFSLPLLYPIFKQSVSLFVFSHTYPLSHYPFYLTLLFISHLWNCPSWSSAKENLMIMDQNLLLGLVSVNKEHLAKLCFDSTRNLTIQIFKFSK